MGENTHQGEELRVILVGWTGLEQSLRRDPRLELVRARTAMDAIGELADPGSGRSVVIVDPGAEPEGAGAGDLGEFLEGLRRVDPGVRVLRVAHNGAALPSGYDGAVPVAGGPRELREFLGSGDTADGVQERDAPQAGPVAAEREGLGSAPALETVVEPKTAAADARGVVADERPRGDSNEEMGLLRRVMDCEPVLAEALAVIRRRTGADDVVFVGAREGEAAGWSAWSSAPVRPAGAAGATGELRSRVLSPADLGREAAWLGAWLELEARQAELRDAAYRDPLTGAWNRRYFDDFLPRAIEDARRARRAVTVLVFDLDDFKRYNDTYGHSAGDEILTECVRLLSAVVRPTDKVCRIGGDEFAVIFYEPQGPRAPDSRHPSSVFDVADRFQAQLRTARFRKLGEEAPGCLTISGGLATYPWDGRSAEELVERADRLALEGKKQGKNVIAIGAGCRRLGDG